MADDGIFPCGHLPENNELQYTPFRRVKPTGFIQEIFMKRNMCILGCVVLLFAGLAGCSAKNSGGSSASVSDPSLSAADQAIAKRKAEAKKTGKYPKVVMCFMNWAGAPKGIARINKTISDYTEEKLGLDVELEILDAASYSQGMTLMLSSGEQADIFNAITMGYTPSVNKGFCLDLEDKNLIQTYGKGILDTMGKTLTDACRIGGKLYGLPQQRDMAIGVFGIAVGKEYLDGIGYKYDSMYTAENNEIIYTSMDEISSLFAKLHTKYPDKYVFAPQEATLGQGLVYDGIGGDNYGVLLDPEHSLDVEDFWSSGMFHDFCSLMYSWNQKGYISKDALTDDTASTLQVKAGSALSYATATKPGIKQQESNLCGRPMIIFQTGPDFMKSSSPSSMPWCINSSSADSVAAMQFLNACYTDPVISNLLCWGEEGKEYRKTADGHIAFNDGITAQNSEYYNNVNWELPNQFIAHVWEGDDIDIWTRMEKFNNNAKVSKAMGFAFNNTSVANEYTALTNVYKEYAFQLIYGFTNPDTGIPVMVAKMKAAGLDTYIDAKKKALTAWAGTNK
jgi:putative aldouronate transport system substrate-binding protein